LVNTHLLQILRCPQDHSELSLADAALLTKVNERIAAGTISTVGGQPIKKAVDGGLIRAAGDLMYPIVGGIPVMLADEAIDVSQFKSK
jgi:uncharacterized protein YbaR (Trm112 family)